jgi:hypothetical protein
MAAFTDVGFQAAGQALHPVEQRARRRASCS